MSEHETAAERRRRMIAERQAAPEDPPEVETFEDDDNEISELRARYLHGVDPDIASDISDDEIMAIHAEEQKKARVAKKQKALNLVRAQAAQMAKADAGLIPASELLSEAERKRQNEPVFFKCVVPMFKGRAAGNGGTWAFRVNGEEFQTGRVYQRPRHIFESLREMHYRQWLGQTMFADLNQDKVYGPGDSQVLLPAEILLASQPPIFEVSSDGRPVNWMQ